MTEGPRLRGLGSSLSTSTTAAAMSNLIALTGSLDDVVFEGRNKAYGAFQLRQSYQRHLSSALFITIAAFLVVLLLPFIFRYFRPEAAAIPSAGHVNRPLEPQDYILPKNKPVVPAAAQPVVTVTPHSRFKTHVVPDADVNPTVESPLPPDVSKTNPNTAGNTPNTTGTSAGPGTATVPNPNSAKSATAAAPEIFLTAEVMPDFIGGRSALQRYLQKYLRFPSAALTAQVSGRVYVSFVVQADGSIGEVTVLKGLGYGTEEAAARVVREMPAWTPGMQNHHSVPVRFTLPITFQFE